MLLNNYPQKYIATPINIFLKNLISFVFPPRCINCKTFGHFLCPNCFSAIPRSLSESEENIFFVFDYHNKIIKKAIWLLKYQGGKELAQIFGKTLYEEMIPKLAELTIFNSPATNSKSKRKIIVIPVPLSRKRLRTRNFNQTEEIARHFVDCDQTNFKLINNLVCKTKETPSQASIKQRSARLKNLHQAFAFTEKNKTTLKKLLKENIVLVIDDVSTTGATIKEIHKILKQAGARQVYGLVVAHG